MNQFQYIPKAGPLREIVHSVWRVEGFPLFQKENILPKGVIEIIFNFSEGAAVCQFGNKEFNLPGCFINGFNRIPLRIQLPQQQKFLGIRLQPMSIKNFLKVPASEFSDDIVDLTLVDSIFKPLCNQLADQQDFNGQISVLQKWIENKYAKIHAQDKVINSFLCAPGQHDLSVSKLAAVACYSTRQLGRKLYEATGMNTEEVLLYKKYLHAMYLIHHGSLSLTEIAYESNFSDQSHFIRTFKTYTGLTPGEYCRRKSFLQGHIFEDVR